MNAEKPTNKNQITNANNMANEQKNTAFRFNAAEVTPAQAFDLIPAGWYHCEIAEIELVAVKGRNGGQRIAFECTVLAGDYKGRKIFGGFNVKNSNKQAEEIGNKEFSALCHAVNIINVEDLSVFKGRQVQIKVKVKRADDAEKEKGYEDRNEPCGFKPIEGATAPASAPAFVPGAPAAPGVPPVAPPPVAPPAAAPAPAVTFPPAGWQAHPSPGYYWNPATQEVVTEADLRARSAPAAPAPAALPPAPPAAPAPAPAPAPVETFPPAGWLAHPQSPGWFYNGANPAEMLTEADLRAKTAAPAPVAPAPVPAAPAVPGVPPVPTAGTPPPWGSFPPAPQG